MGVADLDGGQAGGGKRAGGDHGGGPAGGQILALFRAVDEGDLAGLGVAQRRRPTNDQVAAAGQLPIDHHGKLGKSRLHRGKPPSRPTNKGDSPIFADFATKIGTVPVNRCYRPVPYASPPGSIERARAWTAVPMYRKRGKRTRGGKSASPAPRHPGRN